MRSRTDTDETLLISADGYTQRCRELAELRTEARSALAERLREARRDGHLDDNPALYDLFEEQAQLERRIALGTDEQDVVGICPRSHVRLLSCWARRD